METPKQSADVTFTFDGEPCQGRPGVPIAAALLAAGHKSWARSPKFHRPRGPACFRAACDGCLARVNGVPNIMTCLEPLTDGATVESQNIVGSVRFDVLRITDWFFPSGINHHELFAGVPGVSEVMQNVARRVAGLGTLPDETVLARPAQRREVDALVVGSGPSGMIAALALASAGRTVVVVDDALHAGGTALAFGLTGPFADTLQGFQRACAGGQIEIQLRTVVGAVYGDDVLVVGPSGASVIQAKTLVLAAGAHDAVLPFEGNDLPMVQSVRAAGFLLSYGALNVARCVVSAQGEPSALAASVITRARAQGCEITVTHEPPKAARGTSYVKKVVLADGSEVAADALIIDAPRAPSYELLVQVGAALQHEPRGFVPTLSGCKVRDGVYAVGEMTGLALDLAAITAQCAGLA
jgi:sarcosine oxidase, subunit alpha